MPFINTLKWLMARGVPKKYGDKKSIEHSGGVKFTKIERVIIYPANTATEEPPSIPIVMIPDRQE